MLFDEARHCVRPRPPVFRVDLSDPPRERWATVVCQYRHHWPILVERMWGSFDDAVPRIPAADVAALAPEERDKLAQQRKEQHDFCKQLAAGICDGLRANGAGELVAELEGIVSMSGESITMGELVLLHLTYESDSGCTAVVCGDAARRLWMARTLDWNMPDLSALTIDVEFFRGADMLFRCTSWAGYIGVLTAQHTGRFAVAVNYRDPQSHKHKHDHDHKVARFQWPVGLLVRSCMETCSSYVECAERLLRAPIMCPCYIILCATMDHAMVITRHEHGEVARIEIGQGLSSCKQKGRRRIRRGARGKRRRPPTDATRMRFLVQTNIDHWVRDQRLDLRDSLRRIELANQFVHSIGHCLGDSSAPDSGIGSKTGAQQQKQQEQQLWCLLGAYPILDQDTIHATIMCPSTGTYVTWLPDLDNVHDAKERYKAHCARRRKPHSGTLKKSRKSKSKREKGGKP